MYGASIKQDSCITTMCKKTCFEPVERVGLFREGRLNREDAPFSSIDSNVYVYDVLSEKAFSTIFILFPGLPSQSSFVRGDFKCSFKSMQSSFENHNSCGCYCSII